MSYNGGNGSSHAYHFVTHWRMQADQREVTDILADAEALPQWWPSVYLDVKVLKPGDENGIGKTVSLYTKGWLPYTLRWNFCVTEANESGFTLAADGDFVGRGIWTFEQDGEWLNITYDWKIEAQKPLLKRLSFLLKPVFSQNHEWAMRKGEESLRLELMRRHRRHVTDGVKQHEIPAPPPPTPSNPFTWGIYVLRNRSV